jgi:nucleotide-binding universal stress UspA family protein
MRLPDAGGGMATPFTRIVVGWDGSAGAIRGLQLALQLSNADTGRVIALAVVPSFAHLEDAEAREHALDEVRAPLREAFDAVVAAAEMAPGEEARLEFAEGVDPAGAVDRYTAMHPIDLVVVGLHGREGLLHPKMGHVASHAVQVSRCPVLVVPDTDSSAPPPESALHDARKASLFHPFRHRESAG